MPTFYDSLNQPYILTEQIGRGGEGTVFFCEDFNLVAKIYHEPVTEEKAEKLLWMAQNKNEQQLKVAAWVIDVLHDKPGGAIVGFLMPNVKAKEIHELYSLKSRRVHFPEATWHFLIHTAANLARAFYVLHKDSHIMGDVNHGNCVVLADGTVKLIDCDSYSIKTGKLRYTCEVGVATHLAPELQGADLSEIEREEKHDNFGLAVIIFQLLFLGRHPFAGNYLGAEDKSLEECIRELRFAYAADAHLRKVKQPPGTLSLSALSPRLAAMFERAFLTEDRPEPREWIEALEDLSNSLEQCTMHPGHHYFQELASCPWCDLEAQTGLMLFPFVTSGNGVNGEKPFNIFTVENLITNLGVSQNLPAKLPKTNILPPPSSNIVALRNEKVTRQIMYVVGHFFAMILLMTVFGIGLGMFFGIILMFFFIVSINNFDNELRLETNTRLYAAQQDWQMLENEWQQALVSHHLNDDLARIKTHINTYQNLQQKNVQRMKILQNEKLQERFNKYLSSFRLADAKIKGVSEEQQKLLIATGVESAAEIEEFRLSYFHFVDKKLAKTLLKWRKDIEGKFENKTDAEISAEEKEKLFHETNETRRKIEKDIEQSLVSLRSVSVYMRQKQQYLLARSEKIAHDLLQSESDSAVLGSNAQAIVALLLMTFLMPFFGSILRYSSERSTGYDMAMVNRPAPQITAAPVYPDSLDIYDVPDESITDEEIRALSSEKQRYFADNLYKQSILALDDGVKGADKKLNFALRFEPGNTRILNQLGQVLQKQKRYSESLIYLNRSLEIDPKNNGTKLFTGISYVQMKNFTAARDILKSMTNDFPAFAGFYNLGLAYQGLGEHSLAAYNFRQAVNLDPDDIEAHYELGISFYKLGDREGLKTQHNILLNLDEVTAERLRKNTDLKLQIKVKPYVSSRNSSKP